MKCSKCNKENIISANFCKYCGNKFSEMEKDAAKGKTIIGKIERAEEVYKTLTLQKITGHIIFKILSLTLVLLVGISFLFNYGDKAKVLNSPKYDLSYNEESDEYYIITKNDEVLLNLFIPNKIDEIKIKRVEEGKIIEERSYDKNENIILSTNLENDYYSLETSINDLKLYVYRGEINE